MHVDYLCGSNLRAERAVGTLGVIDDGVVVLHMDGIEFAALFAQLAGDATNAADVLRYAAFINGATAYHDTHIVGNNLDEKVRTNLGTGTATHTFLTIHHCDAVFDIDCTVVTDLDTIAKTQTGFFTGASASVKQLIRRTVFIALIIHGITGFRSGSGALDDG